MEVYTGFEKVSWAKKQGLRKQRPTSKTLSTYERVFKLRPSKNKSEIYIGIGLLVVILIAAVLYYKVPEFTNYNNQRSSQIQKQTKLADKSAFNLLMKSAVYRLKANNLKGAHSELTLAHAIYPNNETVNQLLVETLVGLCEDSNTYCDELDNLLESSL